MEDLTPQLRELHQLYLKRTGLKGHLFPFTSGNMFFWERFVRMGLGREDLELVIRNIQRDIKIGERNRGALKFHNLIVNLDQFREDLAFYTAEEERRKAKPKTDPGKAHVLDATGREKNQDEIRGVRSLKDVTQSEEFKVFVALGKRLGGG